MSVEVLRVEDAGRRLGLGRVAAYRAVKRKQLPALRFGRRLVVPVAALEEMLRTGKQVVGGESR
jgi:excisionase family DNA binding protein